MITCDRCNESTQNQGGTWMCLRCRLVCCNTCYTEEEKASPVCNGCSLDYQRRAVNRKYRKAAVRTCKKAGLSEQALREGLVAELFHACEQLCAEQNPPYHTLWSTARRIHDILKKARGTT